MTHPKQPNQPEPFSAPQTSDPGPTPTPDPDRPAAAYWIRLPYTPPFRATLPELATRYHIPLDDLNRETLSGIPPAEVILTGPAFDPLNPVRYNGVTYTDLHHLARTLGVRVEQLYWLADRKILTPDRLDAIRKVATT